MTKPLQRRVGVFGGTFDPVHVAHLALAERSREELELDLLLFVPANIPPHKQELAGISAAEHRLAMLRLAVESNPHFGVSTIELDREGVSYTVDTLRQLGTLYDGAQLVLLMGGDSARDFHTWHEPEAIASLAEIAVFARPEIELPEQVLPGVAYRRIDAPLIEVSSTFIRQSVRTGRSIRYLTPDSIVDFIARNDLYIQ